MKAGIRITGRVSRVSVSEAKNNAKGESVPARTYVVISYEGGNVNVLNQSKTLPVVDQRIDADIECELQQILHFGNITTAAFPRNLLGFVVSKEQKINF